MILVRRRLGPSIEVWGTDSDSGAVGIRASQENRGTNLVGEDLRIRPEFPLKGERYVVMKPARDRHSQYQNKL